jgi:hypothetical protein
VLWTPWSRVWSSNRQGRVSEPSRAFKGGKAARRASSLRTLAVEGAEESLTILPDYTPTVRPPPKRTRPSDKDMLNPTSDLVSHCHRRVYGYALVER